MLLKQHQSTNLHGTYYVTLPYPQKNNISFFFAKIDVTNRQTKISTASLILKFAVHPTYCKMKNKDIPYPKVDGTWTSWSPWVSSTARCDLGSCTKVRNCTEARNGGRQMCQRHRGEEEVEECVIAVCSEYIAISPICYFEKARLQ